MGEVLGVETGDKNSGDRGIERDKEEWEERVGDTLIE